MHRQGSNFYIFHREELVICTLNKLAFRNPYTFVADMIFSNISTKWGKGCNFLLRYFDKRFGEVVNMNSLNVWISMFLIFNKDIQYKYYNY